MGSGALYELRACTELQLVDQQVPQLRQKDTESNQGAARLERPAHAGIIASGVAPTSPLRRERSHTSTKIGTMVSSITTEVS